MPALIAYLFLLGTHWVADFVLQSHWMASNKSERLDALMLHVAVYSLAMCFAAAIILPINTSLALWLAANSLLHFLTDYCSSRLSSRLWRAGKWHDFFVVIGADQLVHRLTLGVTMWLAFYR
jgi:hypothetical protein